MLTGILTTACGAVLAGLILLAAVTLAQQVRASWRERQEWRQFTEDADRYIATVHADMERARAKIADLRRTGNAHRVRLPAAAADAAQGGDGNTTGREA